MPDQKTHVDIHGLAEPDDFEPNGLKVVFKFTAHTLEEKTFRYNGIGRYEDVEDDWEPVSVRVHQTDVPFNALAHPVTLPSGRSAKVKFIQTQWPVGSGYATLWVLIEPV